MTAVIIAAAAIAAVVVLAYAGVRRMKRRPRREEETPYRRGLDALIAGDREAAMKHLASAVREDPTNVDAFIKLGNLLRERGQVKQAVQIHRELLVKRKLPPAVRTEAVKSLARDLAQVGRWREVLDTLGTLPRGARSDLEVLTLSRDAYEAAGDLDKAAQTHRDVLKATPAGREPSPGVYRAHLGLLAMGRGDSSLARSEFQAAVKAEPQVYLAYVYLGDIARKAGDAERAVAYWMKLVAERSDCVHLVFERLEKAYFEMGDFGRMMGIYEELVAASPSNVMALVGLSKMLERKGDVDEALRVAHEAVKHEGDAFVGHRQLVDILVRNGRFEEVAEATQSLLDRLEDHSGQRSCPSCGAALKEGGWRCGACRSWIDEC